MLFKFTEASFTLQLREEWLAFLLREDEPWCIYWKKTKTRKKSLKTSKPSSKRLAFDVFL